MEGKVLAVRLTYTITASMVLYGEVVVATETLAHRVDQTVDTLRLKIDRVLQSARLPLPQGFPS